MSSFLEGVKWGLFVAAIGAAPLAMGDEQVWVKQDNVQIRQNEGAVYPIVASVCKGQQLDVLLHDRRWLKVSLENTQGYVFEECVSPQQIDGGSQPPQFTAGDSSILSSGSLTRGLQPETIAACSSGQLRAGMALLQEAVERRAAISAAEWEKFTAAGRVGPHAPQVDQ